MKSLLIRFFNWALGIFGITLGGNGPVICEYGVPYVAFELKGKVIDSHSKAGIRGVSITLHEAGEYNVATGEYNPSTYTLDSSKADRYGDFVLRTHNSPNYPIFVKIQDIDLTDDSEYREKTIKVVVDNNEEENNKILENFVIELDKTDSEN
ncbi:MAG: radical SAM-associated putative lipoprotein [Bacteroidales bacterium]|nr:radical SAM-associated putative lipoprotein [Bacteroidales bacterium]MBO7323774.1 radical SAM-associated putative lipoprotein [Bacteroidales bacterium]